MDSGGDKPRPYAALDLRDAVLYSGGDKARPYDGLAWLRPDY